MEDHRVFVGFNYRKSKLNLTPTRNGKKIAKASTYHTPNLARGGQTAAHPPGRNPTSTQGFKT